MKGKEIYKVEIILKVPKSFNPIPTKENPWNKMQCLHSYISHWLEEGYWIENQVVNLPQEIEYRGFTIKKGKDQT